MASNGVFMGSNVVKKEEEIGGSNGAEVHGQIPLQNLGSRRTILDDGIPPRKFQSNFARIDFLKFGSASANFRRLAQERDEMSRSVASSSSHHFRERINGVFDRDIDWPALVKMTREWIRNPMNMALFMWILCVAISGAILFLVMTGMLNSALPKKSQRDTWFEVNNQILNALFTLMCLYQHPKRIYHLILLCRWNPEDISRLRKIYCKNGTYKPHEWAHMMVVVVLLHVNCFAQYALCGLNLGYTRSERPAVGVGICISVAIAAPAIAGVYTIISPLGKDYHSEMDEEAQIEITTLETKRPEHLRVKSFEKRYSFAIRDEDQPGWSGGILDIWDDISLAYLSLFCTFCVFGWNMERLGLGNMYVHIATFLLFCMAPFWIFSLAAVNINDETVREALGITGIILCAFGLLYGGFWRIQMRKRFNLPAYTFCFGKSAASDCALWLCCCWCSLAQEVRTGNAYTITEDTFRGKQTRESSEKAVSDLNYEAGSGRSSPLIINSSPSKTIVASSPSQSTPSRGYHTPERELAMVNEESPAGGKDETMTPPAPPSINRETTDRQ